MAHGTTLSSCSKVPNYFLLHSSVSRNMQRNGKYFSPTGSPFFLDLCFFTENLNLLFKKSSNQDSDVI